MDSRLPVAATKERSLAINDSLPRRSSRAHLRVKNTRSVLRFQSARRGRRQIVLPLQAGVKIYTRTGDKGHSSLYNGERVPKTHPILDALGHVDELNSAVGLAREYIAVEMHDPELAEELVFIQARLMDVGSAVATPVARSNETTIKRVEFDPTATEKIESWIDRMDAELPPLTEFILPSGGLIAAQLHMARSVCRRAERSVVHVASEVDIESIVAVFLNRLSDYLFVAARHAATKRGNEEQRYKKPTA